MQWSSRYPLEEESGDSISEDRVPTGRSIAEISGDQFEAALERRTGDVEGHSIGDGALGIHLRHDLILFQCYVSGRAQDVDLLEVLLWRTPFDQDGARTVVVAKVNVILVLAWLEHWNGAKMQTNRSLMITYTCSLECFERVES